MKKRILVAVAVLAVLAPLGMLAPASAAPVRSAHVAHVAALAAPQSCSNTTTGEAYPRQGNYDAITIRTNTCHRELRAVALCYNGHSDFYAYGGGTEGVGNTDFALCGSSNPLEEAGCQVLYGSGWSIFFVKWIAGQGDPNPYACP